MSSAIDLPDWVTSVSGPTQQVFDGFFTDNDVAVAQFASVIVRVQNLNGTTPPVARYSFLSATGLIVDQGVLSADALAGTPTWTLPVLGPTLKIENLTGGPLVARITGLPVRLGKRMTFDYLPWRTFSAVIPNGTPNVTQTPMPGVGMSLDANLPDVSCYNGLCTYACQVNPLGGAGSWTINQRVRRLDGSTVQIAIAQLTSNALVTFQGGHPDGFCSYVAINFGVLTAQVTATVTVTPSENT